MFDLVPPFPDESLTVTVRPYDPSWPADFALIAAQLRAALGDVARAADHVGSISIPGMSAKDCIDVQVRVNRIDRETIVRALSTIGFRLRDEPWNTEEGWNGGLIASESGSVLGLTFNHAMRSGWPGAVGWAEECPALRD